MAKKKQQKQQKPDMDKVVKKVSKKFDSTSSQIEKLVNDAIKQFDSLQNQVQEPVRRLIAEIEQVREREMKRFNEELERRMKEFHELQNTLLEKVGMASKGVKKDAKKAVSTTQKKAAQAASTAKKAAPAAAKKPAGKASAKPAAKAADPSDLTRVKGIGPVTANKLKDAGITSISQVANPSAADKEKLKAFSSMKDFDKWAAEAKKAL